MTPSFRTLRKMRPECIRNIRKFILNSQKLLKWQRIPKKTQYTFCKCTGLYSTVLPVSGYLPRNLCRLMYGKNLNKGIKRFEM